MKNLVDKAFGCLVAGLIGDAMGTPTEGKEPDAIDEEFGWLTEFEGDGTDDSVMKYFLADALIESGGIATADDWAEQWLSNRDIMYGKKVGKFFITVLHAADKLRYGYTPRMASVGNMASSSSAMCIAPVGIVNAGHPRAASAQAQEFGSLIHTADVAFCQDAAAAIAAAVAEAFKEEASVDSILEASTAYLKPRSGAEMRGLIEKALDLAKRTGDFKAFRKAYHPEFRCAIGCDSRETVPAALALVYLAQGDPKEAIVYGTNFGRDTDTIATMAAAICGAFRGAKGLPAVWVSKSEAASARDQRALAEALVKVAIEKARDEVRSWEALSQAEV